MFCKWNLIVCTNIFLPFLYYFLSSTVHVHIHAKSPSSGLYHSIKDGRHGHPQTVIKQIFSRQEIHQISLTLLDTLGLSHVPKPRLIDPVTYMESAGSAQFLRQIFHATTQNEHGHVHDEGSGENFELGGGGGCPKNKIREKRSDTEKINHFFQPNNDPPKFLKNLTWSHFNVNQNGAESISMADEIISFVNRGHPFSSQLKDIDEDKQFWFDIPKLYNSQRSVLGAELRIWKKTLMMMGKNLSKIIVDQKYFHISILQVGRDKKNEGDHFILTELDSIDTANWEQGWLRLNVTPAFKQWTMDPSVNFGLVISVKDSETGSEIDLDKAGLAIKLVDSSTHEPFLASFLRGAQGLRNKRGASRPIIKVKGNYNNNRVMGSRSTGGKKWSPMEGRSKRKRQDEEFIGAVTGDGPSNNCQMGMLYVRFKDMEWSDWVLAPEVFIAYYCHGQCEFPLSSATRATNHAIIASMMNVLYPAENSPPTCAPMQLGAIKVLHYDDDSNIQLRTFKEMVVRACGCK